MQISQRKGFATNDKILRRDGDFFALTGVAQQLVIES
jgi:hypothetical protein